MLIPRIQNCTKGMVTLFTVKTKSNYQEYYAVSIFQSINTASFQKILADPRESKCTEHFLANDNSINFQPNNKKNINISPTVINAFFNFSSQV